MHLLGFIVRTYHDVQSSERQMHFGSCYFYLFFVRNHSFLDSRLMESRLYLEGNKKSPTCSFVSLYVAHLMPGLVLFKVSSTSIPSSPSVRFILLWLSR